MITFMKTNLHEAVVVVGDADVYVDIYWSYWAIYGENLVKGYSLQTVDVDIGGDSLMECLLNVSSGTARDHVLNNMVFLRHDFLDSTFHRQHCCLLFEIFLGHEMKVLLLEE